MLLNKTIPKIYEMMSDGNKKKGSCLKTGQHFIFVIIYLLLPIKCIIFVIFDSVSKILFIFFIVNNNNYDSNNEKIAP